MELRVLQYFLAVVREENITRAAESLHVTQPTLSRQIGQLEEELGVRLFTRGRHLKLTEAGVILRRRAEEVTALMDKVENELKENSEIGGIISIGSGGLMALHDLGTAMDGFKKKYPNVQYRLYTNSAEYVKERLEQGILDFGILLEPIDVTKFEYIRMRTKERWGLLVNTSHHLAGKEFIEREDLLDIPLITTDRLPLQRELDNWMGGDFHRLKLLATHNIITGVTMLVDAGAASVLTVEGAANMLDRTKMVFRPLYPELSMTSVLAWKKHQTGAGIAGKFLEYFKSIR